MPTEAEKQVEAFKEGFKKEVEILVKTTFPERVIQMQTLLENEFRMENLERVHADLNIPIPKGFLVANSNHDTCDESQSKKRKLDSIANSSDIESGSKVYSLPNGTVPCNPQLYQMIKTIKPCIRELIENANKIKMWISFLIPKIEDGNNFGVSIQEDTLAEARQIESEAATYLDQLSRYFLTRAKVVSKVAKYPHVEDYRKTVEELDDKEFMNLRLVVIELRNHYSTLHDVIIKNLEKIKKPRTSNTSTLY